MNKNLEKLAKDIALLVLDISYKAKTGHVGSALSISDILTVLYFSVMNIGKSNLKSPNRDIFILSKGHAAAALYAVLFKKDILSEKEIDSFGEDRGLCEHPEIKTPGVEMTTGSLGHGLAFGIGMALAQKKLKSNAKTFVLISDGECNEGSTWEAALLAPMLKLDNLTVIIDYDMWQCFGKVSEIINLEPFLKKWSAFGWKVTEVQGHKINEIKNCFESLPIKERSPNLILAHTISGRGVSAIEDQLIGHFKVFTEDEYKIARLELKNI